MARNRSTVLVFVLCLLAVGCGGASGGGSPSSASTGAGSPTASPTISPSAEAPTVTYQVWFAYGESLFVTQRTQPFTPRVGTAAVTALLAGPSAQERAAGVLTTVPEGSKLLGLSIDGGIATANLSADYASGGGSLSMSLRLAQLTYTLTQFPTVRGVNLELDGKPVTVFSGEGIVLDRPMTRRSYADLLPPILVVSPVIGEIVSGPITVAGTADVFEATVSITVVDADGHELVSTFAMATCGTGCRGAYARSVTYHVDEDQPGTVRVYEVSAKDGRPINEIDIPVTLTA
jgi:hypothetical protein